MPDDEAPAEISAEQADATITSRSYVVLLLIVAVVGVIVALAAWCYVEGIYQIQQELFTHLPHALGYKNGPPNWWYLPVLGVAGLLVASAISLLPGDGGHVAAKGLSAGGPSGPRVLPGTVLAGLATTGFALVLGPEGPLIALGAGVATLTIGLARRDTPPQALTVIAAAGSFAALAFIFTSPVIAAVILIEATGLGGPKLRVVLIPGLLAAGIGTLVSIGIGSFTGLNTSAYALGPIPLAALARPTAAQFGWTIVLAILVAVVTRILMRGGIFTHGFVSRTQLRLFVMLPVIGLIIAGLAIGFSQASGKSVNYVLFDGQDQLPGLVMNAGAWSLGAVALLIACKGLAYGLSLGAFRGGPTFPAIFLGAAGGIMASHLPGFSETAAVAVGTGAAVAAVLRLPLSAVVLATLLTVHTGAGAEPLIIVGVVVSYVVTLLLSRRSGESVTAPVTTPGPPPSPEPGPEPAAIS